MKIPERHISEGSTAFSSYWKDKSLLNDFLPKNVSKSGVSSMIPYYFEVDDLGDKVAEEYLLKFGFSEGIGTLHKLIKLYPNIDDSVSETTKDFLNQIFKKPDWLDDELLNIGAEFCCRTGTYGLSVLRNYCLMGGYESSAINKPLVFTGALKKGAAKRLTDTVDFWVNVIKPKGLDFKNNGFYSVITTRLIHSFSRLMIENQPQWKSEKWGRPLNSYDMLATNLGFSIAFLDGLHKIGFNPSEKEIEGTLHLWKYIGYLIGIPEKLLVDSPIDATKQLYLWSTTQKGADQDSSALALSLYEEPMSVTFTDSTRVKKFVRSSCLAYNRYLLGDKSCEKLNLPKSKMIFWIRFLKSTNRLKEILNKRSVFFYNSSVERGRKVHLKVRGMYLNEKKS